MISGQKVKVRSRAMKSSPTSAHQQQATQERIPRVTKASGLTGRFNLRACRHLSRQNPNATLSKQSRWMLNDPEPNMEHK